MLPPPVAVVLGFVYGCTRAAIAIAIAIALIHSLEQRVIVARSSINHQMPPSIHPSIHPFSFSFRGVPVFSFCARTNANVASVDTTASTWKNPAREFRRNPHRVGTVVVARVRSVSTTPPPTTTLPGDPLVLRRSPGSLSFWTTTTSSIESFHLPTHTFARMIMVVQVVVVVTFVFP